MCLMIGLHGRARTGKDTAALYLAQKFGFCVSSFAEPLKDALRVMFSLTDEHIEGDLKEVPLPGLGKSPRDLMQSLGTEWGRSLVGHDVWIHSLENQLKTQKNYAKQNKAEFMPLVKDVRYENEAQWIRDNKGLVIHIERKQAKRVKAHNSEKGIEVRPGDVVISNNDSITELYQKLNHVVSDVLTSRGFYD